MVVSTLSSDINFTSFQFVCPHATVIMITSFGQWAVSTGLDTIRYCGISAMCRFRFGNSPFCLPFTVSRNPSSVLGPGTCPKKGSARHAAREGEKLGPNSATFRPMKCKRPPLLPAPGGSDSEEGRKIAASGVHTHLVGLQVVDHALEHRLPAHGHRHVLQQLAELGQIWKRERREWAISAV